MSLKEQITDQGFIILNNVFTKEEIEDYRKQILNFKNKNKLRNSDKGFTIPDFIRHKDLSGVGNMRNNEKIQAALLDIFGSDNYRFCSHNDIGINRICPWHKDKLNGSIAKYETVDIWKKHNGEQHEIVKVLIYLEDHSNDNDGLKVVPKSHLTSKINSQGYIQLKPKIGDVIIFDQRITHRGMEKQVPNARILVSFGFGKNNIFTDNFEKGTIFRQNSQNK